MENDNVKCCKDIADTLNFIAIGTEWVNLDGELVGMNELSNEDLKALDEQNENPNHDPSEGVRKATMWDYFDGGSVYNTEYLLNADKELKHIRLMVACGGPNIWVDTIEGKVCLYWWSDYAEYPLTEEAIKAVDAFGQELYDC